MESMDKFSIRSPNAAEMHLISSWYPERDEININNVIQDAVLLKDGEIVGWGGIKIWAEAVIALNPRYSNFTKMHAIRDLAAIAMDYCKRKKLGRLHVGVDSVEYGEILKKFGFMEQIKPHLALEIK